MEKYLVEGKTTEDRVEKAIVVKSSKKSKENKEIAEMMKFWNTAECKAKHLEYLIHHDNEEYDEDF